MFNRDQNLPVGFCCHDAPGTCEPNAQQVASEFDIETPDCTYTRTINTRTDKIECMYCISLRYGMYTFP